MTRATPSGTTLGLAGAAVLLALGYRLFRAPDGSRLLGAGAWGAAAALAYGALARRRPAQDSREVCYPADRPPVTQAVVPRTPAARDLGEPGRNAEQRLDEAVEETFPASDPIAVHIE